MNTSSKNVRFKEFANDQLNHTPRGDDLPSIYWIDIFKLAVTDKQIILDSNGWLHSQHM